MPADIPHDDVSFRIESLVQAAFSEPTSHHLTEILAYLTKTLNVDGCVIWETSPDPITNTNPILNVDADGRRLFVLASYFRRPIRCARHDLPLNSSITGRAILEGSQIIVNDVLTREKQTDDCAFLEDCSAMISVPVTMQELSLGAINLYRTDHIRFTDADAAQLRMVCTLLPMLYRAARDRVGFRLSKSVDETIIAGDIQANGSVPSLERKKEVLSNVCRIIADTFHCHEVSLFLFDCKEISLYLQDKSLETVSYRLIASTIEPMLDKTMYVASEDNGLTGWVLLHKNPVWIFDLANYEHDRAWIHRLYPNLTWTDWPNVERIARKLYELPESDLLPPLCVMAIPILIGQKVLGVLRCSFGRNPYYFSKHNQDLLVLVAAQISQCWNAWLSRRELETENRSWAKLIENINDINTLVQSETDKLEPDETLIYQQFLDAINLVIPPANLTSVRLIDTESNELYYKLIRGSAWKLERWDTVKKHRAKIGIPNSESAAVQLIDKCLPIILIPDTKKTPYAQALFPEIKRKIIVPIRDARKTIGVLDIRSTGDEPFSKHAQDVARLLGLQLGIYQLLVDTISKLKKQYRQHSQTSADISHQLKGPIYQAKRRADRLTSQMERAGDDSMYRACRAVRGLCRKSQRVVESLKLIAQLARGERIKADLTLLDMATLRKMLIAAAQDAELMVDPSRKISFRVERDSFDLRGWEAFVDYDLLEQAIDNIFDNAGKYSYENSIVLIAGGYRGEHFLISVRNRGLVIRPHETAKCIQREWRGENAKLATQEGSGIGLWIVDNIMNSHGGMLAVEPTGSDGITEIKLVFPLRRKQVDHENLTRGR